MLAENVIKRFKYYKKTAKKDDREYYDFVIERLEQLIPKEPLDIDYSNPTLFVGDCPNCNQVVDNKELHCDRCGQALKWDDTE